MRSRNSCLLTIVLLLGAPLGAALKAQQRPDPVLLHASRANATLLRPSMSGDSALSLQRANNESMLRDVSTVQSDQIEKAAIGAGIGFLFGSVLGSELANRCRPVTASRCTAKGRRLKYILGFGVLGAGIGGTAGALIAKRY